MPMKPSTFESFGIKLVRLFLLLFYVHTSELGKRSGLLGPKGESQYGSFCGVWQGFIRFNGPSYPGFAL
jgi:hypothetical protein